MEGVPAAVVRPSGDLDLATADAFRVLLDGALHDEPQVLVVDLTAVEFLDSSGIAVIAGAMKAQRKRQGQLVLVHPRPIVKRAIDLVGLSLLFDTTGVPAELLGP